MRAQHPERSAPPVLRAPCGSARSPISCDRNVSEPGPHLAPELFAFFLLALLAPPLALLLFGKFSLMEAREELPSPPASSGCSRGLSEGQTDLRASSSNRTSLTCALRARCLPAIARCDRVSVEMLSMESRVPRAKRKVARQQGVPGISARKAWEGRLPSDVLFRILHILVRSSYLDDLEGRKFTDYLISRPLLSSSIIWVQALNLCRQIRTTALDLPRLWSYIGPRDSSN
jgi:hypothetical protein